MSKTDAPRPGGEIIVYQTADGGSRVKVLLEGETVWLTQAMIAELYQTTVPNVNTHLRNIYAEGELPGWLPEHRGSHIAGARTPARRVGAMLHHSRHSSGSTIHG